MIINNYFLNNYFIRYIKLDMAKITSNTFLKLLYICFLLNSFSLVLSRDVNYETGKVAEVTVDEATSPKNDFLLKFGSGVAIPSYIKVTLSPLKDQETPHLCYSPTDADCLKDRRIMATRVDKKPVIAFVKSNEISGQNKNLNALVTCKKDKCGFKIQFEGVTDCEIDADKGTVYSYIASSDNNKMEFQVTGTSHDDTLMQIGIEGSNQTKVKIDNEYVDSKDLIVVEYDGAKFYSYKIGKEQNETTTLAKFTVENAKDGDYIRLTVYTVNAYKGPDNLLYPGGPAVMGLVHKTGEPLQEICLPISALAEEFKDTAKFYLTGKIYSQFALFWPANKYGEYDEDIELEIADGLLSYVLNANGEKKSVCFEFSYIETVEKKDVVFSVQLIPVLAKSSDFNIINPPMMLGQPFRHMLEKGKTLVYHSGHVSTLDKRYSFNVFNRIGLIRMYVAECDSFPDCKYNMDEYGDDIAKMETVTNTGKFYLYDRTFDKDEKDIEAFGPKKKVMVITCLDDGNTDAGYCEFDAAIYTKNSVINLVENEHFAKYVTQGETGTFQMNFNGAVKLLSLGVEIMVHSGEVIFDGSTSDEYGEKPTKYILSNKVFLHFQLNRHKFTNVYVKYTAIKNSFFTIKYVYYRDDVVNDFTEETIYPGESYLVQIDPMKEYKIIHMENNRYKTSQKFLINFFALNCEFKVTTNKSIGAEEVEVPFADGYAQDIVGPELGQIYKSDYINYRIKIENAEDSNYDKKMCMIYVAGLQSPEVYFIPRIVTGNNINQQIILNENFKSISLLYPTPDVNKDLAVYLNVIDKAFYYFEINANKAGNYFVQEAVATSKLYYLKKEDVKNKCQNKDDESFCNILITVENFNSIADFPKTNPMIEITIREAIEEGDYTLLRVPTYLQKGIAKKDFTTGDGYYYYYTDIGKNDQGDVLVNFIRDFGEVYGRIVKKDTPDSAEIEWMNMYRLPGAEWIIDDDHYNKYLKKYHISLEDTEDCIVGCYLILGVRISQIGEYAEDWKFYPFSIVTQINQATYGAEADIITIQVDEFVVGNVDISKNVKISQYYQVWLPRDTYQIQFDWQSELAGLYISIDGNLPTTANADFVLLPQGIDSVKTIDKIEIIEKLEKKKITPPQDNSLEDFRLIIGIWTDKTDSANTELYSLRIHEAFLAQFDLDIVEVNTDQKILCKPTRISESKWRCLFMVTYDDQDVDQNYNLLVYARSTDRGDTSEMYGNFIYANAYNAFISSILRNSTPTYEQAELNSVRDGTSYFYVKLGSKPHHKDQYLYINVVISSSADIMMVASLNSYDTDKPEGVTFYPSPHTEQVVQTNGTLILQFSINTSLIVNIESLGGEGDTYWEDDNTNIHYFRGKNDRLTLTSGRSYDKLIIKKHKSDAKQQDLDPGFVFIIDYYERNPSKNFDEVVYGNSIEIGYSNTDLPINLYSKYVNIDSDLNLAVTFRDSHVEKEGEYTTSPLEIRAFLDKRDNIYNAKTIPEFEPSKNNRKDGIYDPSIKTAHVTISTIEIENIFNILQEDEPTILFHVGKSKAYEYKSYNTFNVEAQFTRTNSRVVPQEKVYNYGKVIGPISIYYKLKNDVTKKIMKIVLSFNGNGLSWSIGDYPNAHDNTTRFPIKAESSRGKITITVEPGLEEFIYLNFWKTDSAADITPQILNYAFEYLNLESEDQFFNYQIYGKDGSIEYKEEEESNGNKTITCTFNRIDVADGQANVTYFLKIADVINYIPGENFQTVAVTETPCYIKYKRNPTHNNNKITLSATGNFKYWNYIQITAQIQQNKALDYVAYNGVKIDKENPSDSDNKSDDNKKPDDVLAKSGNTGLIIGISVTLVIIIIGLIGVIFYFQKKNKSLMDQVKHVSFQQNSAASDPDLLLHKDQNQPAPAE